MATRRFWFDPVPLLPAVFSAGVLASVWAALRWVASQPDHASALRGYMVAWLMLSLACGTLVAIVWAALTPPARSRRTWLGYAVQVSVLGLLVGLAEWESGALRFWDVVKCYLVLAGWWAFGTALALQLRRWGPGVAVILPAVLAAILLAAPVTFLPAIRALPPGAQPAAVSLLALVCPTLNVLAAIAPSLSFDWPHQSVMYALTALGQDIPLAFPVWWKLPVAGLVLAGLLSLLPAGRAGDPDPAAPKERAS